MFVWIYIAFIGDDFLDIQTLKKVGFSICPKDAADEVKKVVDYVSAYTGGKGVLREVVEIVLKSQNIYDKIVKEYGI